MEIVCHYYIGLFLVLSFFAPNDRGFIDISTMQSKDKNENYRNS